MGKQSNSSWESSARWYDKIVGEKGSYHHEKTILPNLLRLMELEKTKKPKVLDLACGQGILSRHLSKNVSYTGVDISKSLIEAAKQREKAPNRQFFVSDLTHKLSLKEKDFSHSAIILALQNIEKPLTVFENVANHLQPDGRFFIVLNHPYFRIPRQTHWEIDEQKKIQYRRVDRYLSPLKIPIQMHPGKEKKEETWSFHYPLSSTINWLAEAGFSIIGMEEWISDKISTGKKAKMENRARTEFPLFLTLVAKKN